MNKNKFSRIIWLIPILLMFSNFLNAQLIYVPDDNFEQNLIGKGLDDVLDNYVLAENIQDVWNLNVQYNNISDLTGIEGFTSLRYLYCGWNNLETIDLSGNPTLEELYISDDATLSSLDLSNNPALKYLYCKNSKLCVINVKNGNNTNFRDFDASNNTNLNCIQVDNVQWSNDNWTKIDSQTSFSEEACSNSCEATLLVSNIRSDDSLFELNIEGLSIAADGSSSTSFEYIGGDVENVSLQFKEQLITDIDFYGSFQEGEILESSKRFTYNHPTYFSEPNSEFPDSQFKELTLQVINNLTEDVLLEYLITIVRPSVLMVHGIWSNGNDSFGSMESRLLQESMYEDYQLSLVNYKSDQYNWISLQIYLFYKTLLIKDALDNNSSMRKIDVMGHSNGGVLSRYYIQSEFYDDDINKLITFNSPHSGSQLPNLLLDPDWSWLNYLCEKVFNNPNKGVISDLRVDSDFVRDLNSFTPEMIQKYSEIGVHSVTSIETVDNVVASFDSKIINWIKYGIVGDADGFLNTVVFGEASDLIVAHSSQIAGCDATTFISNQQHSGSTSNGAFMNRAIELLHKNPSDTDYFSLNGFNPPELTSQFGPNTDRTQNPNKQSETITIVNPLDGNEYSPNQDITIEINGSGNIENIISYMGSATTPFLGNITEGSSNANFTLTIPNDAIGRLEIVSAGFSANGYEDFDSTYIIVTTDAILENIEIEQSVIYVLEGTQSIITILGHYDDGEIRNITNVENLVYSFDQQNAEISEMGLVSGLNEGEDILTVTYSGKSATVPVTIVQSNGLNVEDIPSKVEEFTVFPNPTKGILTIKFPINTSEASATIYDILGNEIIGRELNSQDNIININSFQNGIYLVKIITETLTITKRVVKY